MTELQYRWCSCARRLLAGASWFVLGLMIFIGSCQGSKSNKDAAVQEAVNAQEGGAQSYEAQSYANFESYQADSQDYDQYEAGQSTEVAAPGNAYAGNYQADEYGEDDEYAPEQNSAGNSQASFNARASAPVTAYDFNQQNQATPAAAENQSNRDAAVEANLLDEFAYNESAPELATTTAAEGQRRGVDAHDVGGLGPELATTTAAEGQQSAAGASADLASTEPSAGIGVSLPSEQPLSSAGESDATAPPPATAAQAVCTCEPSDPICMCPADQVFAAALAAHQDEAASLNWVGYDYRPEEGVVKIEMVTSGSPQFSLFQNKRTSQLDVGVHEMVVRFHHTALPPRLRRDINATEFSSPVSYVRMYTHGPYTDVVMTLKEVVPLRLYAQAGNLLATFSLGEQYLPWTKDEWAAAAQAGADVVMAEDLRPEDSPPQLMAQFAATSELPYGVEPPNLAGDAFSGAPVSGGQAITIAGVEPAQYESLYGADQQAQSAEAAEVINSYNYNNSYNPSQTQGNLAADNSYSYMNYNTGGEVNSRVSDNYAAGAGNADSDGQDNSSSDGYYQDYNYGEYFDAYEGSFLDKSQLKIQQSVPQLIAQRPGGFTVLQMQYVQGVAQNTAQGSNPSYSDDYNMEDLFNVDDLDAPVAGSDGAAAYAEPSAGSADVQGDMAAPATDQPGYDSYVQAQQSAQAAPAAAHPVNLEFRNAQLSDVINILGAENNINFIYDYQEFAGKTVTIQLKNVTWTHALRAVLDIYNLGFERLSGSVIKIQSAEKIVQAYRQTKTKLLIMPLSYIEASNAITIINTFLKGGGGAPGAKGGTPPAGLSAETIKMTADERTNALIIEAPVNQLSKIKTLVERLDTQTPQVKIDARIVEVQESNNNAYGIQWNFGFDADPSAFGLNLGSLPFSLGSKFVVAAPADASTSSLRLRLSPKTNIDDIMTQLQWEEGYLDTRILQNTSVIVLNNKTADISSGFEDTHIIQGTNTIEGGEVKVGYELSLSVTPQVTSDGAVSLQVSVTSDDPVDTSGVNRKATKSVNTHLIRASGETAVIGGIYTTSTSEGVTAMPIVNKLPIIGWLFRNSLKNSAKREILILITPTILGVDQAAARGEQLADLGDYNYNNSYNNNYNNNYNNSAGAGSYNQDYEYNNQSAYEDNAGYAGQAYNEQDYAQNYEADYAEANQAYANYEYNSQSGNYYEQGQATDNAYQANADGGNDYSEGYSYQSPAGGTDYSDSDDYYDDDSYNEENVDYYASGT